MRGSGIGVAPPELDGEISFGLAIYNGIGKGIELNGYQTENLLILLIDARMESC